MYIYCLVILRTLSANNGEFVLPLSVLGGLALAGYLPASLFFSFIAFRHLFRHPKLPLLSRVRRPGVIEKLFPSEYLSEHDETVSTETRQLDWHHVPALATGYIQTVDIESMLELARKHNVTIRMESGVGEFVDPCMPILSFSGPKNFSEIAIEISAACYVVDNYRTIGQDPPFGIRQLVDIALKALSPGINDSTTAATCIEHLSASLMKIAQRQIPTALTSSNGKLLLITKRPCFAQVVALFFNHILENAEGNTEVLIRLVDSLVRIVSVTKLEARRTVLQQWITLIEEIALRSPKSTYAANLIQKQ